MFLFLLGKHAFCLTLVSDVCQRFLIVRCVLLSGVTYIKFSKTSEAAFALEEMNGKMLGSVGRPIKVMIASK